MCVPDILIRICIIVINIIILSIRLITILNVLFFCCFCFFVKILLLGAVISSLLITLRVQAYTAIVFGVEEVRIACLIITICGFVVSCYILFIIACNYTIYKLRPLNCSVSCVQNINKNKNEKQH
jgi:hypothetical protein